MITARSAALHVLVDVQSHDAYANLSLQHIFRKHSLETRERALCSEIVYGTLQRQRTIDALLQQVCSRPLADLEASVVNVLRMSLYQLEFLDKVPVYAVLNEAVELTKRNQKRAAGFVNGVLRGYLRDKRTWQEKLKRVRTLSEADALGLELSYPTWLVQRLLDAYGRERAEQILVRSNQKSHLSVRVNRRLTTSSEVLADIHEHDGLSAAPSGLSKVGIRLASGLDVENWDLFQSGKVTIQDEGAMLIAPLLVPSGTEPEVRTAETAKPEMIEADTITADAIEAGTGQGKILDMCAAPGSKSTHLAEILFHGTVLAADIHPHKVKLIQAAAARLQLDNIETMAVDARLLPQFAEYREAFDGVLLDAPCSGLGVLRHRPDIRWRRTEKDIVDLVKLQKQLLKAAVELVKPGGIIVYATCTLLPEENEQVVQDVVTETHGAIQVESLQGCLPETIPIPEGAAGFTLTPELFDTDGFYMCRLRKKS